jgi:catechol 2,3-dioxygenase-like lactoylglutathione lyase family enzyme
MRGLELDRVIVAVPDIERSKDRFTDLLGLEFGETVDGHTNPDAGEQNLKYSYGHPGIEFISPTEDNEVQSFLDENGPGMYGTVFRVADLDEAVAELEEKGVEPIDRVDHLPEAPEAIYHPRDFGGVLTILTEYNHPVEMQ